MKPPKSQPYHRSAHRAALHAWVVAATTVASIGMPAVALARDSEDRQHRVEQNALTPAQAAQRVASYWFDALRDGDREAVLSATRMPGLAENERAALEEMDALRDWLRDSGAAIEPVAHRHAGHWALSAWRLDAPLAHADEVGLIEPVTLYHPAADGLFEHDAQWQVVPQGFSADPALAPLYNADYDELMAWYEKLA